MFIYKIIMGFSFLNDGELMKEAKIFMIFFLNQLSLSFKKKKVKVGLWVTCERFRINIISNNITLN